MTVQESISRLLEIADRQRKRAVRARERGDEENALEHDRAAEYAERAVIAACASGEQ